MSHSDHGVRRDQGLFARRRCDRDLVGQFEAPVDAVDLDEDVRPASLNEAPRAGHDARLLELAEQLGIELHGLAEAADDAVTGSSRSRDGVDDADDPVHERVGRRERRAPRAPGSGCRTGDSVGWPSSSMSRRSTCSLITCSQRQASSCTYSQSRPMTSASRRSARRCLRMTCTALLRPAAVSSRCRSPDDDDEAVALHAGDGLRDRGTGVTETLGDARAQRHDVLFLELEDRAQVHLRRVDEIGHLTPPRCMPSRAQPHRHTGLAGRRTPARLDSRHAEPRDPH